MILSLCVALAAASPDVEPDPPVQPEAGGSPELSRAAWTAHHPVSVGSRIGWWRSRYSSVVGGGHLRLRPLPAAGLELFTDHALHIGEDTLVRDHVIGFALYSPLLGDARGYLGPAAGLCVDFQVNQPLGREAPTVSDVRFGAQVGAQSELYLAQRLSVQLSASLYGYLGNGAGVEGWSAISSHSLRGSTASLFLASTNLTL